MAGLFALSVNPKTFKGQFSFSETLFFGTFYQQHLGEEYSGFAVLNEGNIRKQTTEGLVRPNFERKMQELSGTEGIGYCGQFDEPFEMCCKRGKAALCFSGNLINRKELLNKFFEQDKVFDRADDIEIIANLVLRGDTWEDGLRFAQDNICGSFSLLILTEKGIYAYVSSDSHWPLIIGKQEGAVVICCESGGFSNLGFGIERDLKPGEIIFLKGGEYFTNGFGNRLDTRVCKFLWVYTAFPSATIWGLPVSLVRKKLGAAQAQRDIQKGFIPDIVSFVPDSGRYHGLGYFEEFCRAINRGEISRIPIFDMPLQKYPYAGRSYTPSLQSKREREAHIKILPNAERYDGKILVLSEDSVVRGTQIKGNLVPKLRSMGFKEIHVRASNPELLSHCPWGKSTQPGETLADKIPDWLERANFLGVDSISYNTIEDLKKVFDNLGFSSKQLCVDCACKK